MKQVFVLLLLGVILATISCLLWHEDWKYTLPTPVPENYVASKPVNGVRLVEKIHSNKNKPIFLHFFNPDCPCSRFNIPHFKSLVNKYGDKIAFSIVVMDKSKDYSVEDIRDKFDLDIPVFFDRSIADSCGVYSTPQAVLFNSEKQLYYRGNYNKSRFCEDKNTNYAQMAIDSLLSNSANGITDKAAVKSYGCSLPKCCKRQDDEK
jgi:hypothetical protein